jgi:hypothetical protein
MIRNAMLTLAMVAMVGGCDLSNFGKTVAVGAGTTTGAAIADFFIGLIQGFVA